MRSARNDVLGINALPCQKIGFCSSPEMAPSRFEECKSDELPEAAIVRLSKQLLVFHKLGAV
jgi:predicted Zn-ribbon and HTH transcriptional regulator